MSTPDIYYTVNRDRAYKEGDDNHCAPLAVCGATGASYGMVADLFAQHGRKKGEGVTLDVIKKVVRDLGYRLAKHPMPTLGYTASVVYDHCKRLPGKHMVLSAIGEGGHIVAVADGVPCVPGFTLWDAEAKVYDMYQLVEMKQGRRP